MDVEAEILDLKLRLSDLEQTVRSCGAQSGGASECRHSEILSEICMRMESLQGEFSATPVSLAEVRADVMDVRSAIHEEFSALGIEVATLNAQMNELFAFAQADMLQRFDALRCDIMELGMRLDRLMNSDGA